MEWQTRLGEVVELYRSNQISTAEAIEEITSRVDGFVLKLIEQTLASFPERSRLLLKEKLAVVAVGGYGRGEMFPYSDVDLLITYQGDLGKILNEFTSPLVRTCWDSGLKLGHGVRSVADTIVLCRQESQVATSLVETRLLWGNAEVHRNLKSRFSSWLEKSTRPFIDQCATSRIKEVDETASAVFSLEPDVKRSPGGLRDLQLIGWIGFARHRVADFEEMVQSGILQPELAMQLQNAHDFLTNIRMNLHVNAGRAQDILSRQEQLRLTDQKGISDYAGQRAVERYMQQYFRNADMVHRTARRFVELNRPSTFQERVSARVYRRTIDNKYVIVAGRLNVVSYDIQEVTSSLTEILHLFLVATNNGVRISTRLIETIKLKLPQLDCSATPAVTQAFMEILQLRGKLATTIRDLFECGVLEVLIPQFSHVRGLLQFNLYHAYTVDEHTFRTLEYLDKYGAEESLLGKIFRQMPAPEILALALLLHDLGKGYEEDHSILGEEIAYEVGRRFLLPVEQTRQVALLVREHLSMSLIAFRRDTSDPELIAEFCKKITDSTTLDKLYLLTVCDIQAVAPGIWNDWKATLLKEFYQRASLGLQGSYNRLDVERQLETIREQTIQLIDQQDASPEQMESATAELSALPEHYLLSADPERIAETIQQAQSLQEGECQILDRFDIETGTLELTVTTRQPNMSRCFHRLVGVLTALNYSILTADIYTSQRGLMIDRFLVTDRYSQAPPSARRMDNIREKLQEAVFRPISFESLFQRHRRYQAGGNAEPISNQKSIVQFDAVTSSQALILDVFAHDRAGLLFTISKAIYDLDLSITLARITTHVDQVVDVFYVTDLQGGKIETEEKMIQIRDRLQNALEEFERYGYRQFAGGDQIPRELEIN